ncbi:PEP-CTERM sorting domain-containing protein [Mitsuaria sp. GD03876]|uniref:beta strand repeat-containing protein n=1 Tax=Mitsuaria sp. GD03876 TaxID=2975399 RepID=UPI0024490A74|nr:PEP-CTERM sorting domain-containing protein [Mitsuaria sp. GD03876]MDH0864877.1 PEP-CTERM sorting domain-containing protein [Mitsuaria sp. GD03876]
MVHPLPRRSASLLRAPALRLSAVALAALLLQAGPAAAASFDLCGAFTAAQTLGSGSGQTGALCATGTLAVGGSTVAVTISGNNATLNNLGSITQTGTGRVIRDNTGVQNLVINNGSATNATASLRAQDADVIQMNKSPASVTLNNWGVMTSTNASAGGNQVVDFNAIASGVNIVNNMAGATMLATEADAVRPGVNGVVNNAGTIRAVTTTGSSSDGIDFQANSGITFNNLSGGLLEGGRHGVTGGPETAIAWTGTIDNAAGATIRGMNGSGLNFDGFNALQVITVRNAGLITGNGVTGDGDGVDIDGPVNLTNSGTIRSINAFSALGSGLAFSEGISAGGGTIRNSGLIEGLVAAGNTNAVGRGISLVGNDITSGVNAGKREALYTDTTVTNLAGGVIRGQSDSAIYIGGLGGSGKLVRIDNQAGGTIVGGGTAPAILSASDYDTTVVNAGRIDGSASGVAIDLGAGRSSLVISGGQAEVLGNVRGASGAGSATLRFEVGNGNQFSYAGGFSRFNQVQVESGRVVLSGQSQDIGAVALDGGVLELRGDQRLGAAGALAVNGGTLKVVGGNQSFASLALLGSGAFELDGAGLSFGGLGSVVAGSVLSVTQLGAGYALRFAGDLSHDASFLNLVAATKINGQAVSFSFSNGFTVLSAVPEPSTYAMLLAGIAVLGWRLRRRMGEAR